MTSRSKNTNLNKEPFEGYVRHWRRQWVQYGDRSKEDKGAWTLKLIKWVQTESRVGSGPERHPHIAPVKDLSLVPGARIGGVTAPEAVTALPAPADLGQQPSPADAASAQQQQAAAVQLQTDQQQQQPQQQPQQQQQQQQPFGAPAAPAAAAAPSAFAGASSAAAAAAAAASGLTQIPRTGSLNALSIDMPSSQQDGSAAAATGAGPPSFILPSPSVVTGGAFGFSHASVGQLQLQTTGSDFAQYAAGAPSAGAAATASGYTAGTERTDSDALGRLPHAGGPAASEYTDSMDVDIDGAGGASQGGMSQQRRGGVSIVAGSMDTGGDMDDMDEGEEYEGEEDEEAADDADEGEEDDQDDDEDQGYDDDGLADAGDMP